MRLNSHNFSRSIRRAVSLLEVLLAMTILVILTSMTYWFYFSSLKSRDKELEEDRKLQLARTVVTRMATEIRQAVIKSGDQSVGIRGDKEQIWITTVRLPDKGRHEWFAPTDGPPPGQYDLVKVDYHIARHPDEQTEDGYDLPLGLARVEIKVPRPSSIEGVAEEESKDDEGNDNGEASGEEGELPEGEQFGDALFTEEELLAEEENTGDVDIGPDINWDELYAPEIHYVRFCYYDGYSWWDKWDLNTGDNPLPQMVMVTVGFNNQPPTDEGFGLTDNEEFCECMNRDPIDCKRLPEDQLSTVVRVQLADPFFRSRVGREAQGIAEELNGGQAPEEEEGGTQ